MKLACLALLGAALLRGQTFSEGDLLQWLAVWQQKQQLQDWTIGIQIARRSELGSNVGVTRFEGGKRVRISVLNAAECIDIRHPENVRRFTELTVVHELVHVSLDPLRTSANWADDVTEDIAEALFFGKVPTCATPRDFMEAEIVSLAWKPEARIREQVIRKLTAAFLDGRPSWTAQHAASCASAIKTFFARSGWRWKEKMIWQWLGMLNRIGGFLLIAVVAGWLIHLYGVVSGVLVLLMAIGMVVRNSGRR
jgi:hypothetical protein